MDSTTARRASDDKKSTKEAEPECRKQRSTEAKKSDDEQKIYEKSTAHSRQKEHSQQQARRTYPTCQLQAEKYEENNVSKKGVGPMTRQGN